MQHRYSIPAILLHWMIAVLMLATLGVGLTFEDMPFSMAKLQLINYHKWAGVTVLLLAGLRLAWRLIRRPPPPLASLEAWEEKLSQLAHLALYLLMFAIPLSGWIMSSAKGYPVVYLGVIPLPDLIPKQPKEVAEQLKEVHELLAWGFIGLLGLHIAGALKHQWLDKKPILYRMGLGRIPKEPQ